MIRIGLKSINNRITDIGEGGLDDEIKLLSVRSTTMEMVSQ